MIFVIIIPECTMTYFKICKGVKNGDKRIFLYLKNFIIDLLYYEIYFILSILEKKSLQVKYVPGVNLC